ncbi:hypothetical protein SEVIR_4G179726v4 [Setaria viridis]
MRSPLAHPRPSGRITGALPRQQRRSHRALARARIRHKALHGRDNIMRKRNGTRPPPPQLMPLVRACESSCACVGVLQLLLGFVVLCACTCAGAAVARARLTGWDK